LFVGGQYQFSFRAAHRHGVSPFKESLRAASINVTN
jgi:hypothetical protein